MKMPSFFSRFFSWASYYYHYYHQHDMLIIPVSLLFISVGIIISSMFINRAGRLPHPHHHLDDASTRLGEGSQSAPSEKDGLVAILDNGVHEQWSCPQLSWREEQQTVTMTVSLNSPEETPNPRRDSKTTWR